MKPRREPEVSVAPAGRPADVTTAAPGFAVATALAGVRMIPCVRARNRQLFPPGPTMQDRSLRCSRRKFLSTAAAITLGGGLAAADTPKQSDAPDGLRARPPRPQREGRKPIAVVCTVYRPLSHAYHIAGRFLHGYVRGGQLHV